MQVLLSIFIFLAGITGINVAAEPVSDSVEIGIAELSPSGEVGGYAVPASGCGLVYDHGRDDYHSYEDCRTPTISADPVLLRVGATTTISWDTRDWPSPECELSPNVGVANAYRSNKTTDISVTGETTFTIDCGPGGSDSVTVYVLPEVEES